MRMVKDDHAGMRLHVREENRQQMGNEWKG